MGIKEVYERYEHLDDLICSIKIDADATIKDVIMVECWQAIKAALNK